MEPLSETNPPSFSHIYNYDPDESVPSYESSQLMYDSFFRPTPVSNSSDISPNLSHRASPVSQPINTSNGPTRSIPRKKNDVRRSLKKLGLKFLNARQHFLLATCRDLSLIPPLIGLFQSWRKVVANWSVDLAVQSSITSARVSEHFLTGLWCFVAAYLLFSMLDGLMIRWIVKYLTSAAIVRMLSMSTMVIAIEQYLASTFSAEGYKYGLHIWILISCFLTLAYIVQNFVTSSLDRGGKTRARFFDFYNIVVFAVVPVGIASFITMIGLLRSLLILRLDIEARH